jgi:pimeloyl-ACP methyl ester carboxylesterase
MPVGPRNPRPQTLVVMLHGDRGGELEQRHIDGWRRVGGSLVQDGRTVLFLVRPGYRTPAGDSSGWANPRDDDYTARNVARVAGALAALREELRPRRIVLVGHSGGAAMSALVLARHPGVADGALLLGCPCDVPPWRMHRSAQRNQPYRPWAESLNPLAVLPGIPAGTPVLAATGARDDNTLPIFARRWSLAATQHGALARFEEVEDHDHQDILRWPELPARVQSIIDALPR